MKRDDAKSGTRVWHAVSGWAGVIVKDNRSSKNSDNGVIVRWDRTGQDAWCNAANLIQEESK